MNARTSIQGSTNTSVANLGCIGEASKPLTRAILGCIEMDNHLKLDEERGYRAGITRIPSIHESNKQLYMMYIQLPKRQNPKEACKESVSKTSKSNEIHSYS